MLDCFMTDLTDRPLAFMKVCGLHKSQDSPSFVTPESFASTARLFRNVPPSCFASSSTTRNPMLCRVRS